MVLLLLCFGDGFLLLSSSSLYSITNLLTLKHRLCETSQQQPWPMLSEMSTDPGWPRGLVGKWFSLKVVMNPAVADGRGSSEGCVLQPRCSFPNCRPVFSTWAVQWLAFCHLGIAFKLQSWIGGPRSRMKKMTFSSCIEAELYLLEHKAKQNWAMCKIWGVSQSIEFVIHSVFYS